MMKILLLVLLGATATNCSDDKKVIEREDLIGKWKETEIKKSRKTSAIDLTTCKDNISGAEIYTFERDGTYSTKNFCSGEVDSDHNTWTYADHILTLKDSDEQNKSLVSKYSVSDQGENKIKLSLVVTILNEGYVTDWSNYYLILQKQ